MLGPSYYPTKFLILANWICCTKHINQVTPYIEEGKKIILMIFYPLHPLKFRFLESAKKFEKITHTVLISTK